MSNEKKVWIARFETAEDLMRFLELSGRSLEGIDLNSKNFLGTDLEQDRGLIESLGGQLLVQGERPKIFRKDGTANRKVRFLWLHATPDSVRPVGAIFSGDWCEVLYSRVRNCLDLLRNGSFDILIFEVANIEEPDRARAESLRRDRLYAEIKVLDPHLPVIFYIIGDATIEIKNVFVAALERCWAFNSKEMDLAALVQFIKQNL